MSGGDGHQALRTADAEPREIAFGSYNLAVGDDNAQLSEEAIEDLRRQSEVARALLEHQQRMGTDQQPAIPMKVC